MRHAKLFTVQRITHGTVGPIDGWVNLVVLTQEMVKAMVLHHEDHKVLDQAAIRDAYWPPQQW